MVIWIRNLDLGKRSRMVIFWSLFLLLKCSTFFESADTHIFKQHVHFKFKFKIWASFQQQLLLNEVSVNCQVSKSWQLILKEVCYSDHCVLFSSLYHQGTIIQQKLSVKLVFYIYFQNWMTSRFIWFCLRNHKSVFLEIPTLCCSKSNKVQGIYR